MAVHILKGSHERHVTADTISFKTLYKMSLLDFDRGFGDFYLDADQFLYQIQLPRIGDNYLLYYGFQEWDNPLVRDCVCTDITEARQNAKEFGWTDASGLDRDNLVVITYTWSNRGLKDIIVPDDWSSVKFLVQNETEVGQTDFYYDTTEEETIFWKHKYFTITNPQVLVQRVIYNDDNEPQIITDNNKLYNDSDVHWQKYWMENVEVPPLEFHNNKTLLTVKVYSRKLHQYLLAANLNTINSVDFLKNNYDKRTLRLIARGKYVPPYYHDMAGMNDQYMWRFDSYNIQEYSDSVYEYSLNFVFKKDGWNKNYGIDVNMYLTQNFNAMLDYMLN